MFGVGALASYFIRSGLADQTGDAAAEEDAAFGLPASELLPEVAAYVLSPWSHCLKSSQTAFFAACTIPPVGPSVLLLSLSLSLYRFTFLHASSSSLAPGTFVNSMQRMALKQLLGSTFCC